MRKSNTLIAMVVAASASSMAWGAVHIDDTFGDGVLGTNPDVGTGFVDGSENGGVVTETGGAAVLSGSGNWVAPGINSNDNFDFLNANGVKVVYTTDGVSTAHDRNTAVGWIYAGDSRGDYFQSFAVVSADRPKTTNSIFPTVDTGALYVQVFYERGTSNTDLTAYGQIRVVNKNKTAVGNGEADGLVTLGTFTFDSYDGQSEMDTTIIVNQDGWSVGFSEDVTVALGSLTGSWDSVDSVVGAFSADITDEFDNGAYVTATGQVTGNSSGQVSVLSIHASDIPEPASMALMGLGGLCMVRRTRRAA